MMRCMERMISWCICPNCTQQLLECEALVGDMRCVACATIVILVDCECLFSQPDARGPFHRCTIERILPQGAPQRLGR
jgi:hypothetical protein